MGLAKNIAKDLSKQIGKIADEGIGNFLESAKTETIARRRIVCNNCIHQIGVGIKQCSLCGCVTNNKTILASQSCPIGKWVESKKNK